MSGKDDKAPLSTNRWFQVWSQEGRASREEHADWYWAPVHEPTAESSVELASEEPSAPSHTGETIPESVVAPVSEGLDAAEPSVPEIDDPELLRLLDEEFAELGQDIERLTADSGAWAKEKQLEMFPQIKEEWLAKIRSRKDQPYWRKRIEAAIAEGFDGVLKDGADVDMSGGLRFAFSQNLVQDRAMPVLHAALAELKEVIAAKLINIDLESGSIRVTPNPTHEPKPREDEYGLEVEEEPEVAGVEAPRRKVSQALKASKRSRRRRLSTKKPVAEPMNEPKDGLSTLQRLALETFLPSATKKGDGKGET